MSVQVEVGPQMKKVEQVCSDNHQLSLVGDGYVQMGWVCWGDMSGGCPYHVTCELSHDA